LANIAKKARKGCIHKVLVSDEIKNSMFMWVI